MEHFRFFLLSVRRYFSLWRLFSRKASFSSVFITSWRTDEYNFASLGGRRDSTIFLAQNEIWLIFYVQLFLHLCRAAIYVILLIFCSWVLASVYSSTAQFLKDSLLASLVCLLLMCIKEGFMEPRASLRLAGFDALKFGDAFFSTEGTKG